MNTKNVVMALLLVICLQLDAMDKSRLNERLLYKVGVGSRIKKINHLLNKGADINERGSYSVYMNITPLCLAIAKGNVKAIKLLLNVGADINKTAYFSIYGMITPLFFAVLKNKSEIVKLLLTYKNVDVNKDDPLLAAIAYGSDDVKVKMVKSFLACKDIRLSSRKRKCGNCDASPLAVALGYFWRDNEIVFLLLNRGALINDQCQADTIQQGIKKRNITPLQIAIAQGDTQKALSILKEVSSMLGRDDFYINQDLLEIPAICGDANMMYFLLQKNPSQAALQHAFLKIKDETDDKSMMIKKMLVCWDNIQNRIKQTADEKEKIKLRAKFDLMMLDAAIQHKQLDLFFFGQRKGYMMSHIARMPEQRRKQQLEKKIDGKMLQLRDAMAF